MLPECLGAQRLRVVVQSVLQVAAELGRAVIDERVREPCCKCIAGMVRADEPLAHGQCLDAGRSHHVTRARIHEDLQQGRRR